MQDAETSNARMTICKWLLWLACIAFCAGAQAQAFGETTLDHGWQFRLVPGNAQAQAHPEIADWHPARVPGTVHTDLLANRLIPDPYVGTPEAGLQWIGLADWEYRTRFDAPRAMLDDARSDLVFEGLDTLAEVWLNGEKLLDADNAFRTWRVPVQGRLRGTGNELRVVFRSPIAALLPKVQAPTLLIVGGADTEVLKLNRKALKVLSCEARLDVVPGATHLFEEAGALDKVTTLAADWFLQHRPVAARRRA